MVKDGIRWIRENVPIIVYPEERGTIERDRERWRQRIRWISFLLRW